MRQFDKNLELEEELEARSLKKYLSLAKNYWWLLCIVLCIGAVLSFLYTKRQPSVFEATASVVIDPQPPQVFGSQVQEVITLGTGSFWSNQEYYNTQVEVLNSFDLAKLTIEKNNLEEELSLLPNGENLTKKERVLKATETFTSGLSVLHSGDSRIVTIHVKLGDPELAVRLANFHVETFLDYTRGLRTGGTGEISKYLAKELDIAEKNLHTSEDAVLAFKRENNLLSTSIEDAQSLLAKELIQYSGELVTVRIRRVEQGSALKRAKALLKEDILESPIFTLATSTGVEELKLQFANESRKLRELEIQYGPKHPHYKGQKKQVAAIKADLRREARRTVRELEERYQATLEVERKHKTELNRLTNKAASLEPMNVIYNRLKVKQAADNDTYESLQKRLSVSNMTGRNEAINIRKHEISRFSRKIGPKMPMNIVISILFSLFVGFALVLLLESLDKTIKTVDQVESLVNAPILGVIPVVPGGNQDRSNFQTTQNTDLYVHDNPSSKIAECCRAIRTNILFTSTDKRMKIITVSSPKPKEGKSTTTIYIATIMAQSGQRVLIIDTDLRRPRIHKSMEIPRENGLSTLILGETTFEQAIQKTRIPGLSILSAGPQPPNPAELLLTKQFKDLLLKLEDKFDLILLDSPPLLAVSDPVVLSRLSDGVLLVLQAGNTKIDDAKIAVRSLHNIKAPILGVVLNYVDLDDRRYGYGSDYNGYGGYAEDSLGEI